MAKAFLLFLSAKILWPTPQFEGPVGQTRCDKIGTKTRCPFERLARGTISKNRFGLNSANTETYVVVTHGHPKMADCEIYLRITATSLNERTENTLIVDERPEQAITKPKSVGLKRPPKTPGTQSGYQIGQEVDSKYNPGPTCVSIANAYQGTCKKQQATLKHPLRRATI